MTATAYRTMAARSIAYAQVAAVLVAIGGGAGLGGWLLDIEMLKSVVPGAVTMKANTAVAFALAGASLWLLLPECGSPNGAPRAALRRRAGLACASIVLAIGAATLVQYAFDVDLGVDRVLWIEAAGAIETAHPGRMAIATALGLALNGLALVLMDARRDRGLAHAAVVLALVPALLAITSYASDIGALRRIGATTSMALPTAVLFCLLGTGIVAARPGRGLAPLVLGEGSAGIVLRRLLPVGLALPILLGRAWVEARHAQWLSSELALTLLVTSGVALLFGMLWWIAIVVQRVEAARYLAEAGGRESEQRFHSTFEQVALGFALVSPKARFVQVNGKLCAILGYSREEMLQKVLQDIAHPADVEADRALMRRMLAGEVATKALERRCIRKDGSVAWAMLTVSLKRDAAGRPDYFVATVEDISDRRASEEALREFEWMLTKRPVPEGSANRVQPYGDLRALNTERTILDAVGPELLGDIVDDYMSLLETSSAVYEKNGDYAHGIFTSGWCRTMDMASFRGCGTGEPREALHCGRWHCHESCWNEASRPSMALDAPTDIACRGGIRLYAVPIRAGDEVIGSINFGYGDPPRDRARLEPLAREYGVPVETLEQQAAAYRPRPPFIIELAKQRLQGSARLIGEIVQRKRAQDALNRANATLEQRVAQRTAELEAANRELEGFAYSVSHDLRAPLRAIDGFSRLLETAHAAELSEGAREFLKLIRNSTQQMGELLKDLLSFAQLNRQALRHEIVQPEVQVRECLELLSAERNGRQIALDIGPLPACEGDASLLKVVWMNLLSNAFKYTRRTTAARIEVGCRDNGGEPAYYVRDNGVGFNMAYAGKLFGVFQRLHRSEDYEGTGVGLATAQRIVQRHGGRIWAEAELNRGATFFFTLGSEATPAPAAELAG